MTRKSTINRILKIIMRSVLILVVFFNLVIAMHAWKFTHFYNDPSLRVKHESGFLQTAGFILMGDKIPRRLNDSLPTREHEAFTITTSDGLHLRGWLFNITGSGLQKPAVFMFHGHGSCRAAILPEAYAFLQMGYPVYMIDFRAHGNSEGEQCLIGMKESADVKALCDFARKNGEQHFILWGASMGASTILRAVNEYGLRPDKMILEMPFASMEQAVEGKLRIMHLPQSLAPVLNFWGSVLNGSWGFSYKPVDYATQVKCPVLLQWGKLDPRVTEGETKAIYNNLSVSKQLVIYGQAAHESLYAKERDKWTQTVSAFLK